MSLTLFLDTKSERVGIVRWFKDPGYHIAYPCGPLQDLALEDFRHEGSDFVRFHFEEYQTKVMNSRSCIPVFQGDEAKSYLKGKLPISVSRNHLTGDLTLSPLRFRKYSLGELEVLDNDLCRRIAGNFTVGEFWEAFDAVLAELI